MSILRPLKAVLVRAWKLGLESRHGVYNVQGGGKRADRHAVHGRTRLKIVPNHSCLTAACHPLYFVVKGDQVSHTRDTLCS